MKLRGPLLLLSLMLAASLYFIFPTHLNAQSSPAPVLVYYYAWWAPEAVGPGKSPDWPITPYHSWDVDVIQGHVSQVASAGIDGMVVAWYGPEEYNNQTETNFRVILDQAQANGITALLSVDLANADWFASTQEVIDGLNYALSVHAQHPAYFRLNGKPVLFFWFQGRYSQSDWAVIRQQVDPNHNSIWIAEGAALDALPTFDGLHLYTISWSQNVYATESQWSNSTHSRGGLWVGTAMPGWDNTYTQQSERYIRERQDGAFYRESFSAAAASAPEMIIITSWNEWWEGTHIEPSANYGDFYLQLTSQLIAEYKGSGAVFAGNASAPPIQPTIPSAEEATQAGRISEVMPAGSPTAVSSIVVTRTPTSTLPPTITPTVSATVPSMALAVPQITPTRSQGDRSEKTEERTSGALEQIVENSTDRWEIGGSLTAAVLGLTLVCSAVIAYRRTVEPRQ